MVNAKIKHKHGYKKKAEREEKSTQEYEVKMINYIQIWQYTETSFYKVTNYRKKANHVELLRAQFCLLQLRSGGCSQRRRSSGSRKPLGQGPQQTRWQSTYGVLD